MTCQIMNFPSKVLKRFSNYVGVSNREGKALKINSKTILEIDKRK